MHRQLLHDLYSSNRHAYSPRAPTLMYSGCFSYSPLALWITITGLIPIISVFDVKFFGARLFDHCTYYLSRTGYRIFVTHVCCTCTIYAMTLTVDSLASHGIALSTGYGYKLSCRSHVRQVINDLLVMGLELSHQIF